MMAFMSDTMTAFNKIPMSDFTQEMVVLGVFMFSFCIWRRYLHSSVKPPSKSGKLPPMMSPAARTSKLTKKYGATESTVTCRNVRQLHVPTNSAQVSAENAMPSVRAAEKQMIRHLEQREFTRALNMYRTLERDGRDQYFSKDLFDPFIQSAIRVHKVDVVERLWRTMKRNRITPSIDFWQIALKMLSSRKHFSACLVAYQLYGSQMPCDKVVYSCLINAALELGDASRAAHMLESYSQCGVDAKDHVLFFRTYVALNDVDSAEACFRKLGAETSTLMLNLLLLTCINTRAPDRARRIIIDAHDFEEKAASERFVDVVSYNTVIKGYAQLGRHAQCFDCLNDMRAKGLEPDDITFGTLLDSCIVDNNLGAASEVVNLLIGRDKPMDTVMCTLFMKGLVRANCLPKAMELYDEMKRRDGVHPDIVMYSVLIKALVDQHELERAMSLVDDMNTVGMRPDDIILTHLLEGCRHTGNHARGKKLFQDMLDVGVKPSEFTLVTMLKLHGRCGAHKDAMELVKTWEALYGIKPSVIHYTCIMSGCLRTKKYDQAWEAYELMSESCIALDETAISTLLPGLVAAHQWDRLLLIVRRALKAPSPIRIPPETMNNALSQMYAVGGVYGYAVQLQQLMQECGIPQIGRHNRRVA